MKNLVFAIIFLIVGSIAFQGFQCASKEFTTAKMKFRSQEYDEAVRNLELELRNNPKNDEAKLLLAKIKILTNDLKSAATILNEIEKDVKNKKIEAELPNVKAQLWITSYNGSMSYYNAFNSTKDVKYLDSAIFLMDVAITLIPENPDFYYYQGIFYESKGDVPGSMNNFKLAVDVMQATADFAIEKEVSLNMPVQQSISKLGTPKTSKIDTIQGNPLRTDEYEFDTKKFYVFSGQNDKKEYILKGFRYDSPTKWSDVEKRRWTEFNMSPYGILAQYYYDKKVYDSALVYLNTMATIDPTSKIANQSIVQIYQEQGNEDVAFNRLEDLSKKFPNNPAYLAQWGDMLTNMERYDDAIAKYEAALKIDPKYDFVLRNLASVYKNKAVVIQVEEQNKVTADPRYNPKVERYFPFLDKSAEFFAKALETDRFRDDFTILSELANIYQATNKKDKLQQTIDKLEDIEFEVPQNQKSSYYYVLLKLYNDMKNAAKSDEISKKLDKLGN